MGWFIIIHMTYFNMPVFTMNLLKNIVELMFVFPHITPKWKNGVDIWKDEVINTTSFNVTRTGCRQMIRPDTIDY